MDRILSLVIGTLLLFGCGNQDGNQEPEATELVQEIEKAVETCVQRQESIGRLINTAIR